MLPLFDWDASTITTADVSRTQDIPVNDEPLWKQAFTWHQQHHNPSLIIKCVLETTTPKINNISVLALLLKQLIREHFCFNIQTTDLKFTQTSETRNLKNPINNLQANQPTAN